jgi:hypothetical protein
VSVRLGHDSREPQQEVEVSAWLQHPGYAAGGLSSGSDIGLVLLERAPEGVTPIPYNTVPLSEADVGRPIRHVGYGLTDAWDPTSAGRKFEGQHLVRQVRARQLESGSSTSQTCSGDSGGPGFMVTEEDGQERVAGVVSSGDRACEFVGYDTRVDAFVPWLQEVQEGWQEGSCSADGACVLGCVAGFDADCATCALDGVCRQDCQTPDPDCACARDGVCSADCPDAALDEDCPRHCGQDRVCALEACARPDLDCVEVGGGCTREEQCPGRRCVSDPQHPQAYCSLSCEAEGDCPQDMECLVGACRKRQLPAALPGEACSAGATFCTDGSVCPAGLEDAVCGTPCDSSAQCPEGHRCLGGDEAPRACQPPAPPPTSAAPPPPPQGCSSGAGGPALLGLLALQRLVRRRSAPPFLSASPGAGAGAGAPGSRCPPARWR